MEVPDSWVADAALALWRDANPDPATAEPYPGPHRDHAQLVLDTVATTVEHALTDAALRQRAADADTLAAAAEGRRAAGTGDAAAWEQAAATVRGVPAVSPTEEG